MPSHGDLVGPFPEGVEPQAYDRLRRRVLWQLPSGLYLLGTGRSAERRNLMTLNWLTQVATTPKRVAVSVEHPAFTHALLESDGCFAVSVLDRADRALVRKFVKPADHDADTSTLNGIEYRIETTGAPVLSSAASWLDCEVVDRMDVGSHTIFVGDVVNAGGDPERDVLRMEDTRMNYGG